MGKEGYMMTASLERFVDTEFVYRFTHGPNMVTDEAEAREKGINCVLLAHFALRELFGHSLPPELHCYEMFTDNKRFYTVDSLEGMYMGDLVWFGTANPRIPIDEFEPKYGEDGFLLNHRDSAVKHVALYTGERSENDFLLLHSTHIAGGNVIWPLSRFSAYKRYEKIY